MPVTYSGGNRQDRTIVESRLVAVEGADDQYLVGVIANQLELTLQVHQMQGKEEWGAKIELLTRTEGFDQVRRFGLVRDADLDSAAAFASVAQALRNARLTAPTEQLSLTAGNPQTAIYIVTAPGANSGELEDLCLSAIEGEVGYSCIQPYLDCASAQGRVLPGKLSKAKLHAYIAVSRLPGARLREAALANIIPIGSSSFDRLTSLMRSICQ